jgi:hypothetical protein
MSFDGINCQICHEINLFADGKTIYRQGNIEGIISGEIISPFASVFS